MSKRTKDFANFIVFDIFYSMIIKLILKTFSFNGVNLTLKMFLFRCIFITQNSQVNISYLFCLRKQVCLNNFCVRFICFSVYLICLTLNSSNKLLYKACYDRKKLIKKKNFTAPKISKQDYQIVFTSASMKYAKIDKSNLI